MIKMPLAAVGVSELLPPDLRKALMDCENWPPAERWVRIDKLTDEAARRGLVRERDDVGMLAQWDKCRAARRPQ